MNTQRIAVQRFISLSQQSFNICRTFSTIPSEMKAVKASKAGGPDVLNVVNISVPTPTNEQVLIKVHAAGINRPDVYQRKGLYPPPKGAPDTLGLEVSGEVVQVGSSPSRIAVGDSICALVNGGGYAEYCVAEKTHCLKIAQTKQSKDQQYISAAAIPESLFTVWKNLFSTVEKSNSVQLKQGQTLLVHGGSSGIGSTAIQLAAAQGIEVFTTAGTDEKCKFAMKLGAKAAINYKTEPDWDKTLKELNNGRGVDCILDFVGGSYLQKNIDVLNAFGSLVLVGFLESPISQVNMMKVMLKSLHITGSVLRSQPNALKSQLCEEIETSVWPLIESGDFKPIVNDVSIFDGLEKAADAHKLMESSEHIGKIVIKVAE